MAKHNRIRNVLIPIIIVIILPFLVYFIAWKGKNVYKRLPYLGIPTGIDKNGDTIYHTVPPFRFTDQHGRPYGSDSVKGKVYVAEFFFTSCPNICPVMADNLKKDIYETYKGRDDFRILSFSLDPKRDSVARLAAYAAKRNITGPTWHFLTGSKDSIARIMNEKGFLIVKPIPNVDPDQLQHSEIVSLVDKEGHIRGAYNATDEKDIERLKDEIHLLMLQYDDPSKQVK